MPGVEPHILDPIRTWRSKGEFAETAGRLVQMFRDNFKKFEDHTDERVRNAGSVAAHRALRSGSGQLQRARLAFASASSRDRSICEVAGAETLVAPERLDKLGRRSPACRSALPRKLTWPPAPRFARALRRRRRRARANSSCAPTASSPLSPTAPKTGERRRIVSVAERHQRPGVAAFGRALEERPRRRDVALGEGDEALGAQAARVVDRNRRATRSDRCPWIGPRSALASLLIASLAMGWATTAAFCEAGRRRLAARTPAARPPLSGRRADGSMRGQKATTRTPAKQPAIRPATTFHSLGRARPPLLHQAAPAREIVVEPIGIVGCRSSAGVGRRFGRRAERVERGVGRGLAFVEPALRRRKPRPAPCSGRTRRRRD